MKGEYTMKITFSQKYFDTLGGVDASFGCVATVTLDDGRQIKRYAGVIFDKNTMEIGLESFNGHCYKTAFDGTGKTKEELHENMMNILKYHITLIMLGV